MVTSALSQETLARRLGGREVQPLVGTPDEDAALAVEAEEVEADGG